jgi:hypothetical protein
MDIAQNTQGAAGVGHTLENMLDRNYWHSIGVGTRNGTHFGHDSLFGKNTHYLPWNMGL